MSLKFINLLSLMAAPSPYFQALAHRLRVSGDTSRPIRRRAPFYLFLFLYGRPHVSYAAWLLIADKSLLPHVIIPVFFSFFDV